jgi:glycosyltransferase involved in cell wall biosynthesis
VKIRLIGKRNNLGIGTHFANFADALKRVSHWGACVEEFDCEDPQRLLAEAQISEPGDINICFVSIPLQDYFEGTNIQWVVFESTLVPPTVMRTMLTADQVWVPSTWGQSVLIENGLDHACCEVVPEGVDTDQYHPYAPRVSSPILTYLIIGKYELRKSIVETVYAWHQEFGNDPDVELVIKTDHFFNKEAKYNELTQWIGELGLTNVRVMWGGVTANDMADLYQQSHIFVLPTKGEGWGLPLIEAAAAGLPIITTMYSAHTEFLQHIQSSVIPVEFDLVPVACPEYQYFYPTPDSNWGEWAQPRVDSIRQALRSARQNYTTLREQARANSTVIRKQFSWAQSAEAALQCLQAHRLLL